MASNDLNNLKQVVNAAQKLGELHPEEAQQTAAMGQKLEEPKLRAFGHDDDAFEPAPPERLAAVRELKRKEKGVVRRKVGVLVAILVVVFLISALVPVDYWTIYTPDVLLRTIQMAFRLAGDFLSGADPMKPDEVMAICPEYYQVTDRVGISLQAVLCGGLLALAGSLYQMVFRNPIAAPTMLGTSSGIHFGILILVLQFTYSAPDMFTTKYIYCYVGAILSLLIVLVVSWLASGRKRISVVELLLVGSVISSLLGALVMFMQDMFMDDDLFLIYQEVNEALTVNTEWYSYVVLIVCFVILIVPVYFMRYSINAVNYSEDEARLAGINSTTLKVVCLVIGTIMVTVAQVHSGNISMISLVIPFIARAIFGADFRGQFWGDVFIGAALLLVCRDLVSLIPFTGGGIPIGTMVTFIAMPVYVVMLVKKQRGWD